MRKAYQDVFIVRDQENNNQILGVSLGYDFCAEHEWGINGLKLSLGIVGTEKKRNAGVKGRMITNYDNIIHGKHDVWHKTSNYDSYQTKPAKGKSEKKEFYFVETKRFAWYGSEDEIEKRLKDDRFREYGFEMAGKYFKEKPDDKKKEVVSMWDGNDFRIITTNKELYDVLVKAIEKKTLFLGLFGRNNPFANNSLILSDADFIPQETKDMMKEADIDLIKLTAYSNKIKKKIDKKLKKSGKEYFALSPRWIDKEEQKKRGTKYKVHYWLNPRDQQNNNSGWYTVEELYQWAKNEGPVVEVEE